MQINPEELRRLSNLELKLNFEPNIRISSKDLESIENLLKTPVEIVLPKILTIYNRELYKIIIDFLGEYETFLKLRNLINERLNREFNPFDKESLVNTLDEKSLSVLFEGVWIGKYEEIYRQRIGENSETMDYSNGIGTRLADITFGD